MQSAAGAEDGLREARREYLCKINGEGYVQERSVLDRRHGGFWRSGV